MPTRVFFLYECCSSITLTPIWISLPTFKEIPLWSNDYLSQFTCHQNCDNEFGRIQELKITVIVYLKAGETISCGMEPRTLTMGTDGRVGLPVIFLTPVQCGIWTVESQMVAEMNVGVWVELIIAIKGSVTAIVTITYTISVRKIDCFIYKCYITYKEWIIFKLETNYT